MKMKFKNNIFFTVILSCAIFLAGCGAMPGTTESPIIELTPEPIPEQMIEPVPEPTPKPEPESTPQPTPIPTAEPTTEPGSENSSSGLVGELTTKTIIPNESNVKTLGRTEWVDDTLWMVLPGTGAEFTFVGTKLELTLQADESTYLGDVNSQARIAIYVNGECTIDDMIDNLEGTYQVFESEEVQECTIKVVKLSEAVYSSVGIKSMNVTCIGDIKPTEPKEHLIEFVGDSLICGFGVEDEDVHNPFSTAMENVTMAYAYKTAEALNADYSMVAYSGYGVISGFTFGEKVEAQLLPTYYSKLGITNVPYLGRNAVDIEWDFSKRQPDLIVVNLGSNDYSYTGDDGEKQQEFANGYVEFLKQIRSLNPNATILCTLGIMETELFDEVQMAVQNYTLETGDSNIHTFEFTVNPEEDGLMAGGHPCEESYGKAAGQLTAKIQEIMGW